MHTPNISCACLGPRWLVEPPVNVGIQSPETNPIGLLEKVTIGPICRRSKINQWIVSIKYSNKYKISNKYPFQTHQILWFNVQGAKTTPGHPVPSKKKHVTVTSLRFPRVTVPDLTFLPSFWDDQDGTTWRSHVWKKNKCCQVSCMTRLGTVGSTKDSPKLVPQINWNQRAILHVYIDMIYINIYIYHILHHITCTCTSVHRTKSDEEWHAVWKELLISFGCNLTKIFKKRWFFCRGCL